ncbi:MAG: hypothetical protein ACRDWH_07975, partial [Acidimicrobiia bacterium]
MDTGVRIEAPADAKWHHVVSATVLAALGNVELDVGRLGDFSVLLNRALTDLAELGGVERLRVSVWVEPGPPGVEILGQGVDIEGPQIGSSQTDPITGSVRTWT